MLRVPELKPGDTPFDPDFHTAMQATGENGRQIMTSAGKKEKSATRDGIILMGIQNRLDEEMRRESTADGEHYRKAAAMRSMLNHFVVKDAVTMLHREDDEQMARLEEYSGMRIGDIIKEQDRFVRSQEAKYAAMFAEPRQKHLFQEMTRDYFAQALDRAHALRNRKIREYRADVIERQNSEFIDRALRQENIFDDALQTRYRDMILFNLENLLDETSEKDRRRRLDAASAAFYRKIFDTRLELDPERVRVMLDAPVIRRVIGEEAMESYEEKVAAAIRDEELRYQAKQWVDNDIGPDAAKKDAEREIPEETEREKFLTYYYYWRYNENRKNNLTRILNAANAWNVVVEGGMHPEAIPAWVRRNDSALRNFLLRMIEEREKSGGLPPAPEYVRLADLAEMYDPYKEAEKLRDEDKLFGLIAAMGGPDTPAFQIVLRLLLGKLTESDRAWLTSLAVARKELLAFNGGEFPKQGIQEFLCRFDGICRIRREQEERTELDELEIREIIQKCLALGKRSVDF